MVMQIYIMLCVYSVAILVDNYFQNVDDSLSAYLLAVLTGPDSPIQYTAYTIYAVIPVRWWKFWADHPYHFKLVFEIGRAHV